jgi:hypothetical protein
MPFNIFGNYRAQWLLIAPHIKVSSSAGDTRWMRCIRASTRYIAASAAFET